MTSARSQLAKGQPATPADVTIAYKQNTERSCETLGATSAVAKFFERKRLQKDHGA